MKHQHLLILFSFIVVLLLCAASISSAAVLRAALIGDYGRATSANGPTGEAAVAAAIKSWKPDCIMTMGDNNYPNGLWSNIDANIGQFYGDFIYPLADSNVSSGAADQINKFYPVLGNRDSYSVHLSGSVAGAWPYLRYLHGVAPNMSDNGGQTLMRYYSVRKGSVHFLMLNSNHWEPDGIDVNSKQAQWVKAQLAQSTAPHRVIIFHHLPYTSSSKNPPTPALRWPYKQWGASVVISGHAHSYERLVDSTGFVYLQNGLGGTIPLHGMRQQGPVPESRTFFNSTWGYQTMEADDQTMTITFHSLSIGKGVFQDKVVFPAVYQASTAVPLTAVPAVMTTSAPSGGNNSNNNNKNVSGGPFRPAAAHKSNLGTGLLLGVVSCIALAFCVYAIVWIRRRRQERVEEALGGGGGRRTFSITPHMALAHETDYREMSVTAM